MNFTASLVQKVDVISCNELVWIWFVELTVKLGNTQSEIVVLDFRSVFTRFHPPVSSLWQFHSSTWAAPPPPTPVMSSNNKPRISAWSHLALSLWLRLQLWPCSYLPSRPMGVQGLMFCGLLSPPATTRYLSQSQVSHQREPEYEERGIIMKY